MNHQKKEGNTGEKGNFKSSKSYKKTKTTYVPPTHPAIIITSDFEAPHINKLTDKLS